MPVLDRRDGAGPGCGHALCTEAAGTDGRRGGGARGGVGDQERRHLQRRPDRGRCRRHAKRHHGHGVSGHQPQTGYITVSVTSTQPRLFSALWGCGKHVGRGQRDRSSLELVAGRAVGRPPYSTYSIIVLDKTAASGLYITGASLTATGVAFRSIPTPRPIAYTSSAFYRQQAYDHRTIDRRASERRGCNLTAAGTDQSVDPSVGSVVKDPLANALDPDLRSVATAAQALELLPTTPPATA